MTPQASMQRLRNFVSGAIVGQSALVDRLMIALLADGHLLVEGAPGLAKTRAIRVLGEAVEGDFHRIQFTPDLLPSDLTGTDIYHPQDHSFDFQPGPLFHNLILADEINRAPAKVQSALLEAMAERQITVGSDTYQLPELFLVMATQNPIEQEGTYPLPEAQLDRFLLHVKVDYPDASAEAEILKIARNEALTGKLVDSDKAIEPITQAELFQARREVVDLYLSEPLEQYLLEIIQATRNPARYGDDLARWIQFGASPRATIALDRCARANAWIDQRDYVNPDDIRSIAHDVLRHRLMLTYEAEAEGITPDSFIDTLLDRIAIP